MKILQVYETGILKPGASVANVVFYLSKYLSKKGCEVVVLERGEGGNPYLEKEGIKVIQVKCENLASIPYKEVKSPLGLCRLILDRTSLALEFNKVLRAKNFDVIHVHFPFASAILVNINRKLRDKIVYTAHADEYRLGLSKFLRPPLVARIFLPDLYLMKRVRKSVVLNEPLKEKLVGKGIEEGRLEVIPNGVNVEDFNLGKGEIERVKEKYELNETTVMFSGTVTPRKGVEYLVKAAEILKEKNVLFLIVGNTNLDREYANKVMEYAKLKNLKVRFTGFVPYEDLKALYSACDIFVLPSLEEGFGIVLTEALASGKPLIGSNVGGIPMQIRDGWNGFLVEPGNEKQLAEKIKYLIDNPEERERMGKNSRKLAEEKFNWIMIADKYLRVYEEVVR